MTQPGHIIYPVPWAGLNIDIDNSTQITQSPCYIHIKRGPDAGRHHEGALRGHSTAQKLAISVRQDKEGKRKEKWSEGLDNFRRTEHEMDQFRPQQHGTRLRTGPRDAEDRSYSGSVAVEARTRPEDTNVYESFDDRRRSSYDEPYHRSRGRYCCYYY
ncbi:hypothetical protein AVEN_203443-1 [Araneus ventricosus]|uniref:Uncharacterized protein n=1 Tax=Araneus ventricosus TaxID=182803 RepID=A0A4Y2BIR4_ARAVE|nr:hypothetical protein AVEN_203443-1 [Araneus ventricosus]